MATTTQNPPRRTPSHPLYANNEGLSPKKTAFIIVTVIGCIAILWPKVFYPMMFGGEIPKPNIKDQRPGPGGKFYRFNLLNKKKKNGITSLII